MKHRKYRAIYGTSFYSPYYFDHVNKIRECWRDSGGRVSNLRPDYYYGNIDIMANFYLICDIPVKFIDVSNDVGKNIAKDIEQDLIDNGQI